ALRRRAVPVIDVEREQRRHAATGSASVMSEVVFPDLTVVVGEAVRVGLRFGEQKHSRIFVGVRSEQDDSGRLKILPAVSQIPNAGYAAARIRDYAGDLSAIR